MIMSHAKTILIVEDEKPVRYPLRDKLTWEGFTVFEAEDGQEGLKKALELHPDIILLDIVMPKLDGLTVLKKLRLDAWGKDAIVILLTNLGDIDKIASAAESGVADYLVKADWKLEDVVLKVREKLAMVPKEEE